MSVTAGSITASVAVAMRWIVPALVAITASAPCPGADRPKPVNTAHLQVKYLFESGQPGLEPLPRYEIRSGESFSTLLPTKAQHGAGLRVHSISASPDGRVVLIREEAVEGLKPFQWTLIYRSPNPKDTPEFRELFVVATEQRTGTERLVANRLPIHANKGGTDPALFGRLKLLKLENDHLTFEGGPLEYKIRFEDCFENFPKPEA